MIIEIGKCTSAAEIAKATGQKTEQLNHSFESASAFETMDRTDASG